MYSVSVYDIVQYLGAAIIAGLPHPRSISRYRLIDKNPNVVKKQIKLETRIRAIHCVVFNFTIWKCGRDSFKDDAKKSALSRGSFWEECWELHGLKSNAEVLNFARVGCQLLETFRKVTGIFWIFNRNGNKWYKKWVSIIHGHTSCTGRIVNHALPHSQKRLTNYRYRYNIRWKPFVPYKVLYAK